MQWIVDNWGLLLALVGALLVVAKLVAKLTPTPKDDEVVAKVEKVVEAAESVLPKGKP